MSDFEREDMELNEMFHGDGKPMHPETIHITLGEKPTVKPYPKKSSDLGKDMPKEETPVNAQWEPEKPTPNYMDKLRTSAKDMSLYAILSVILFWWQQSGRLDETTAWYALLFCVGMVFFTIGRAWNGAVK
jgi:hypothetical protein